MSVLRFLALFGLVFQFLHFKKHDPFVRVWCLLQFVVFPFLAFGVWQKYEWFLVSDTILNPSQRWSLTDLMLNPPSQRAKKVVSDSPGLVDFAVGLVNSVFNLPSGQVMFFEEFE